MPEGLSDQDRAKIEAARQSASGCLGVVSVVASICGAFVVIAGLYLVLIFGQSAELAMPIAIITAIVAGFFWLYRWLTKQ